MLSTTPQARPRSDASVGWSVLGVAWAWFYATALLAHLPVYVREFLGGNVAALALPAGAFAIGLLAGGLLTRYWSGDKIEIGLVPIGSIGLSFLAVELYFAQTQPATRLGLSPQELLAVVNTHRVLIDFALAGAFLAFYLLPLYGLIRARAPQLYRSYILAGNLFLNLLFMGGALLLARFLLDNGLTLPQLWLVLALMNAVVAALIYSLVPEFLMRCVVWLLINTLYRIDKQGLEHIPAEGPCMVVCNHVSFVDALILGGNIRRPVRFVMDHRIFKIPGLGFIFRTAKAIPIAPAREDEALMLQAFDDIESELRAGNVVGIFPEGAITRDGEIAEFRRGIERILERTPVPVVPAALCGLWGSVFSRRDGALKRMRIPRRFWSRIALRVGVPVPPQQASAAVLEQRVRELRGDWA